MSSQSTTDSDQIKERVRQDWSAVAPSWRRWHREHGIQIQASVESLQEYARIQPGQRVLDLCSGTGEPSFTWAEMVGPSGHVTATDLSQEMLDVAADLAWERELNNMTFQVADAEALPFPDQSFDSVTCLFGVMFFPDVHRAMNQVRRVLKPGGRAAFLAWGAAEKSQFSSATRGVLAKYAPADTPPPAAEVFRYARPGTLSAILHHAGFRGVQEETRTVPWPYPGTPEEGWEFQRHITATRKLWESVPSERRQDAESEVLEAIGRFYDGQQVNYQVDVVIAGGDR